MTEVEFSRLMSELADTAKTLNRESDSINEIIERFERSLQGTNLGQEVWHTDKPLTSRQWAEGGDEGRPVEQGTTDEELGFSKLRTGSTEDWRLVVRTATYVRDADGHLDLRGHPFVRPLLDCSRALRIRALSEFPSLAKQMKHEAEEAIKTIKEAKQFVK